jgi:RNA polymerase sigma factor (sigma-70 family)
LSSPPHDVSQLLAEHGRQLHALLFRLTLRNDVADDLLQDLFCKLAQSEGFRRADKPAAFAFRTAMNLAFDWRRSKKRMSMSDADITVQPSSAPSAISDLVRREELEQTLNAIGELRPADRDILVLRYLQQQSYETIADQFGKTAHQIRALAHKALESLRKLLGVDAENAEETENIEEAQRAEGK